MRGGCPDGSSTAEPSSEATTTPAPTRDHPKFKGDAVELVHTTGRPIAQVAKELGIYDSTLGNWVRQAQIDHGERAGLTSDERARLGELERENTKLRMERDLLKRTVALWGTEQSTP
jgi:transposase